MRHRSWFSAVLPLILLFALPAFADEETQVFVHPRVPTTATPIQFHFATFCPPTINAPVRDGSVIRIRFQMNNCSPPITGTYSVALPEKTLPAGVYRVELLQTLNSPGLPIDKLIATAVFSVLEGEPQPFRVQPGVSFKGGDRVRIQANDGGTLCPNQSCSVLFGGVAGTNLTSESDGSVSVNAPGRAPGLHDVTIVPVSGQAITAKTAWYVFDESIGAHVDRTHFEHVLVPLLFNGPGANGSQWRSELTIVNQEPWALPLGNVNLTLSMVWHNYSFPALSSQTELPFANPLGTVLLVPRRGAEGLAMSLRVRDISREAEGFGTEIPIVREQDMAQDQHITLLNVPLDAKYRAKLRIYAILPEARASSVILHIQPRASDIPDSSRFLLLQRDCGGINQECSDAPLYGDFDLPTVTNGRADLILETLHGALVWAFVSVTNNETQQVTIVTPSNKGGTPCIVCN